MFDSIINVSDVFFSYVNEMRSTDVNAALHSFGYSRKFLNCRSACAVFVLTPPKDLYSA